MNDSVNGGERTVAIIGAGLIGEAWATVFAKSGWQVQIFDQSESVAALAKERVLSLLSELNEHGLAGSPAQLIKNVAVTTGLEQAVRGAALVQESLPEKIEIKSEIFSVLDEITSPDTILASSTSAIIGSLFTERLKRRERCLVAHPVNPPHLVPLVELCPSPWTSAEVLARAHEIYTEVGQTPIVLKKEVEGFVLNRLQGALMSEALRLVADGIATPQDIDKAVKDGLGPRWSFMGPFETIELNAPGGIGDYGERYGPFYQSLAAGPPAASVWDKPSFDLLVKDWRSNLTSAELTKKRSWRDRRLAMLARHKRDAPI